jgi:hypothetical protein
MSQASEQTMDFNIAEGATAKVLTAIIYNNEITKTIIVHEVILIILLYFLLRNNSLASDG